MHSMMYMIPVSSYAFSLLFILERPNDHSSGNPIAFSRDFQFLFVMSAWKLPRSLSPFEEWVSVTIRCAYFNSLFYFIFEILGLRNPGISEQFQGDYPFQPPYEYPGKEIEIEIEMTDPNNKTKLNEMHYPLAKRHVKKHDKNSKHVQGISVEESHRIRTYGSGH